MGIEIAVLTYQFLTSIKILLQDSLLDDSLSVLHNKNFVDYKESSVPCSAFIFEGAATWIGVLPPIMIDPNGAKYKMERVVEALNIGRRLTYKERGKKQVLWIEIRDASESSVREGLKDMHRRVREELERQEIPFSYVNPVHPSYQEIERRYPPTVL